MIVGTAGHIDHGKSALVRALTGVETDRLAEEKRRGISIDLGFAYLPMPDGGVLGFVDVPGHEHFVRTMLAGATGIDFVLLVIAADDGVMPQTVEHLAILDLLGLTRGLVALTKTDRVAPPRRAAVEAEIARLLAGTGLAGAEIVAVSSVTGEGIDALRARLVASARTMAPRPNGGRFRLAIDRSFTLRGIGTVVTGTVWSGAVAVGDSVTIGPTGLTARVRSIHAQNQPAQRGTAGQRCALNLAGDGIAKDAIARGDMALDPTLHAPTQRIDARLRVLPSEIKSIGVWLPARLHHGATEIGARVVPLDPAPLDPGGTGWVQLVLEQPIAAAAGDAFVLRDTSARRTIGGGRFVDLRAPGRKRRTPQRLRQLGALALPDPDEAVARLLDLPPYHLDVTAFRRDRALPAPGNIPTLINLPIGGGIIVLSAPRWADFAQSVTEALDRFHVAHPEEGGASREALRRAIEPRLPAPVFAAALDRMARDDVIAVEGGLARRPTHESRLAPTQSTMWRTIVPLLSGAERFRPPRLAEIAQTLAIAENELRHLLKSAARLGLADEVAPDHFFLHAAIVEAASIVKELADAAGDGQFDAAALRDRLETGRKNAIELLEYFDRRGVTMRRGDKRRIDPRKLALLR